MRKPTENNPHNELHLVPRLAIADPKVVAQNLIYEISNGETEILEALAKLLELNRNEIGKNIVNKLNNCFIY